MPTAQRTARLASRDPDRTPRLRRLTGRFIGPIVATLALFAITPPISHAAPQAREGEPITGGLRAILETEIKDAALRESVARALADLEHPEWTARREAAARLRSIRVEPDVLKRLVRYAPLSAEQRNQLIVVAADQILSTPAGAIGISMSTTFAHGVLVDSVIPGLPAADQLLRGDVITHFNGQPVRTSVHFGEMMTGFAEGDTIRLRVVRPARPVMAQGDPPDFSDAEIFEVDLTLVSARALGADQYDLIMGRRLQDVRALIDAAPSNDIEVRSPAWQPSVEDHAAIDQVRREIEMLADLDAADRRLLVRHWQQQYEELRRWFAEPGLTQQERQYRRNVLNRYVELLPKDVFGDL